MPDSNLDEDLFYNSKKERPDMCVCIPLGGRLSRGSIYSANVVVPPMTRWNPAAVLALFTRGGGGEGVLVFNPIILRNII